MWCGGDFLDMERRGTIVITGTSVGIGRDLANFFLDKGFEVWGCSRRPSSISNKDYFHTQVDLNNPTNVNKWIADVLSGTDSGVDIFIANAGKFNRAFALVESENESRETFETNLLSTIQMSKLISVDMVKKNKKGLLVYLSSVAVNLEDVGSATYSASKAALETFVKIFAKEIKKMFVNAIILRIAFIESEMTATLLPAAKNSILARTSDSRFRSVTDLGNFILSSRNYDEFDEIIFQ